MKNRMMTVAALLFACADRPGVAAREQALEESPVDDQEPGEELAVRPREIVGVAGPAPDPEDMDGDGVPSGVDIDDEEELIGAVLSETVCNGIDEDGDGFDSCPIDEDSDGVADAQDCDDLDGRRSALATEAWCNGVDENCNGVDDCDRDGDGIRDSDDADPDVPAAEPARADPGGP